MRKIILSLLMASVAATPAIARDRTDHDEVRSERQQSREDRQQSREDRRETREDPQQVREDREVRDERNGRESGVSARADARADRASVEQNRAARSSRNAEREAQAGQVQQRHQVLRDSRELRRSERQAPQVLRNRVPVVSNVPRPGTQPPPKTTVRHSAPVHWNTNWRHNHRYDWHNWRNRHRSLFRLGLYSDPFGWGYQPYSIGWRMWPSYYGSSFWLHDPWQYRLPYAPPGTRWIRYYEDAILVDTWNGQVVDVIYNFFW